jgi:thioredoxin-like negative regulator of GroEL
VIDEQLTKAFKIDTTPTVFLFYRASITQEFREAPSKSQIKEMVRSAQFFHAMVNEERLINQLISEGQRCMDEGRWHESTQLFSEAEQLDKWRDLYGGQIFASLCK